MKYILMTVAALTVAFGLGFLVTGLIRRKIKRKPPMWAHILIAICISLLVICVGSFGYLSIHYPAQDEAVAVFSDQNDAQTFEIEGGYFVDGRGEDTALVFYQGAKVDAEAYLPLMKRLAENGVDCFLLKTPFDMPIFDSNAADNIIGKYDYNTFLLGGHSMGGLVASGYAAQHSDAVDGVVLLAAYPTEKISDSVGLLSVYGTDDKVLDRGAYESAKRYFPDGYTEKIIDGGNHAQFGNYGAQSGDGEAKITAQEQQTQTAFAIIQFAEEIKK